MGCDGPGPNQLDGTEKTAAISTCGVREQRRLSRIISVDLAAAALEAYTASIRVIEVERRGIR